MDRFVFVFFFWLLAQVVNGQVNEFQVGEETIKIPTPAGLKDWIK
jgi:hypothetical protein